MAPCRCSSGQGGGAFSPAPGSPFPAGPHPNDLTVSDFDGNGRPDLAFANHETQQLTVLLGDGKGGFAPAPGSPVAVAVRPHPHGIAAADFNGDGHVDLLTDSWAKDRLELLPGDGKGRFETPGTYVEVGRHPYQRVRVADLNGDGTGDIVSPNLDGNDVTILLGDGRGAFAQPAGSPFPAGDSPFNVAIGDVNADGVPDLAIVDSPSSATEPPGRDGLTVLLGDGRGGFRPMRGSPFATARFPNMVAIGDVDGDRVGDVVVSLPESDRVAIFTMTREGTLGSRQDLPLHGHPKGVAIHDFDGDGRGDLVVANNAEDGVTLVFGSSLR